MKIFLLEIRGVYFVRIWVFCGVNFWNVWSLQVLIKQIDSSDNIHTIGSAISNLLSLTQDGPQLCSIIAKVLWTLYLDPPP